MVMEIQNGTHQYHVCISWYKVLERTQCSVCEIPAKDAGLQRLGSMRQTQTEGHSTQSVTCALQKCNVIKYKEILGTVPD